jgi:hypothetical protein
MIDFVIPILFVMFGIYFIILSKNEKNYQKLIKNNGRDFANKINKGLKMGGYLLLICSFFYLVIVGKMGR